jgi:polar amino acid transport system ATP-binding protein
MLKADGHFLELRGIHKHFGDNHVLRGIDMDVGEHQVVSLIGGSGSGKSTLLRCINALESVNAGTISVEGQLVSGPAVDVDAPHDGAAEHHPGPAAGAEAVPQERRGAGRRALERVGLLAKRGDYPDSLSGGQQQRVAIVRALAMQPKLLPLDGVTTVRSNSRASVAGLMVSAM